MKIGESNARPLLIMTCASNVIPGGGHAFLPLYHHSPRRPVPLRLGLTTACPTRRSRPQVFGLGPLDSAVLRCRAHHLLGRYLRGPGQRPFQHGHARCLARGPTRLCRTATPPQPRLAGRPPQGRASPPTAPGPRPDLVTLPRHLL